MRRGHPHSVLPGSRVTNVTQSVTCAPLYANMISMGVNGGSGGANPAVHFGHQVRKQRKSHGWSIHELSRRAGINAGYLSMIENGKRPPNVRTAAKIDAVFPERDGWFTELTCHM